MGIRCGNGIDKNQDLEGHDNGSEAFHRVEDALFPELGQVQRHQDDYVSPNVFMNADGI